MGFIIILVALVALWVWWKKTHYNDSPGVKERIKGRNADQQAVIRYFCNEPSCLSKKPISDDEYEQMIKSWLSSNDFKKKALAKIGLDEDQVAEIEPVHFEGYFFPEKRGYFTKVGSDGLLRSSAYQVTWLFFSNNQIYAYQNTNWFDRDDRNEKTEEYFYKDVTNFAAVSDTEEVPQWDPKQDKDILVNANTNRFAITVPGDKFYCSMEQNEYTERAIQGMKAMLREKKNS